MDELTLYRATVPRDPDAEGLRRLREGSVDVVTFASSSAVRNLIEYGALEEVLTGWVMGQLPDTDEDIAKAEHDVTGMLVAGLVKPS